MIEHISNGYTPELVGKTVARNCKHEKCEHYSCHNGCDHLLRTGKCRPRDDNGNCILSQRATAIARPDHKYTPPLPKQKRQPKLPKPPFIPWALQQDLETFCRCYNASASDTETGKVIGLSKGQTCHLRSKFGLTKCKDYAGNPIPHEPVTVEGLTKTYQERNEKNDNQESRT